MCDRQQQLDLWRAGYAAGQRQEAARDRWLVLEGARAYQAFLIRQAVELLAELLADDRARRAPAERARRSAAHLRRAA